MTNLTMTQDPARKARFAGLLYLLIIVTGLGAELGLRAPLINLGLVFFGVNSLIMGLLVWRSGFIAKTFGAELAGAGLVYLIGSGLRFFAPDLASAFMPAYGLTILAETAFCLRLLLQRGA